MPFPVRPFYEREVDDIVDDMVARPEQIDHLEDAIVARHAEFSHMLPALPYTQRLIAFLRQAQRPWRCHVHRANLGVSPKLQALACACAGDTMVEHLGNAMGPITAVGTDPNVEARRQLNIRNGNVGPLCRTCFTHYEIVNLYFEGEITAEELAHIPSLSHPETIAHARAIRDEIAPHLMVRA